MRANTYAYHREVENTYLVRDRDRQKRRDLLRVVLWVLPMAAAVLGYIWLQVQVLNTSYDIGGLERELTEVGRTRSRLSLEVAQRSSLPLVEARAREELGMVVPAAESTIFWPEVVADAGADTGADLPASAPASVSTAVTPAGMPQAAVAAGLLAARPTAGTATLAAGSAP